MHPIKALAIKAGFYRQARFLHGALYPAERISFQRGLKLYAQFIKPDDLVFDIGANIGTKTEMFLELGAKVIAVEPQPGPASEIRARAAHYRGMCKIVESGVSDKAETAELQLSASNTQASLIKDWQGPPIGTMTIETTTLDALIAKYGKPQFIKIDIEGYEFHALCGLSVPINYISIEYHCDDLGTAKVRDCISYLRALSPIEINATGAEDHELILPSWLSADNFLKIFPDCAHPHFYGDLIVRRATIGD